MTIHEPMTVATDYLLCIVAGTFAARLWRAHPMWARAFLFTALASLFGGTYHGIAPTISPMAAAVLWKATIFSVGLASFFLLAGTRRALMAPAIVKFVIYASWMTFHDEFVYVIADYGLTLVILGAVMLASWNGEPAAPWVLGSIAVSILAALVQQSGVVFHRYFNHNDLYHFIQIVALWLLYRGGRLMTSWTVRSTTPPM